ncbi:MULTISPECIES: riboflavin synthase [Candidatus Ichthyocystis]|uniref:riboflavin synthase n=1 Tax=Candidatus Ichthyocystis TaxID=2929841 RepID=UPI000A7041E7|nr:MULTISPECIES: riboflavin synthase [Ichthyocystis]
MFTGIVSGIGRVVNVDPGNSGLRIVVDLCIDKTSFDYSSVSVGDSLCVSGVCLTVESVAGSKFSFYVSKETLSLTCGLDTLGALVNLEPSLKVSSLLGGHFMYGHVDCVGSIVGWSLVGDSTEMVVSIPILFAPHIARKCSIAVNGISLTVNAVYDGVGYVRFSVNLIPYTLSHTMAHCLSLSSSVNIEVDMMSRYVLRCTEVFLNNSRNNGD